MATAQLGTLLRHLKGLATGDYSRQGTDRQLVEDFAARRDQTAFATLVARHGAMVLRVCRRVLGHEQDAEDAFQATFLVLARNSGSIRKREAVTAWLHGVAYRTAMKAKRTAARRRNHEARLRERTPPSAPSPAWDDVQAVLDEEIQRLPEPYRAAFVLCVLEGKSGPEAAAELGCKVGTVSCRLTRARRHLQQQLVRRGIKLSAVLAALSLAEGAANAAVPAVLAKVTIRSGLLVAAGETAAGVIPSQVAALAAGVTRAMFLSKSKIAAVVLLAVGLFAAGAGLLTHEALAAKEPPPAVKKSEPPGEQEAKPLAARVADHAKEEKGNTIEVSGRVVDPDGKPFAGATLSVWTSAAKREAGLARETTGKDGRFRIKVRWADLQQQAIVLATAEGYGLDWEELPNSIPKDREVILRLARDDVAINGRLLNLEGRGIAGAVVQVRRMEKRADDGDLAPFIATKQQWARGNYVNGVAMKNLGAEALPMTTSVTTAADGRFRLTGFGRERVVHLKIHGETIVTAYLEVLTRPGPVAGLFTGNENDATCGATFERVFAPSKPIAGTVREKGTGKPLAGITIVCNRWVAKTDAQGRYRIAGAPKQREYTVTAKGPPYFVATKSQVADTPGFEPVGVDFDLERGLAIRGRLLNKATGKPVQGSVTYHAFADNPHLKKVSGLDPSGYFAGADGSFSITGLPGTGILQVLAEEDDYLKVEPAADWKLVPSINTAPRVAHALIRIDPSEKDPQSATFEIALEPAAAVKAKVVGPDGKPFSGYFVAGLTASPRNNASWMFPKESATFMVRGLDVRRPRTVVLFNAEKKLGKAQVVRGDEAGPLQVRLEPLSSLTGRVLDADGRPWAGLHVRAILSRKGEDAARLPVQFFITTGTWAAKLERKAMTDAEGKFRLDGLLPGLKYTLVVSGDESAEILQRDSVSPPEAGRNQDLGDLRSKQGHKDP